MKSVKITNMLTILDNYEFNFDSCDIKEFICGICKGILKNASQSVCGCNFCYECIQNYLKEDSKICPSGKSSCGEELLSMDKDVQIDHKLNLNIASMKVKCPFKECLFEDALFNMTDHIRCCENKESECPYSRLGCVEVTSTLNKITEHLHDSAYYHGKLVTESIENITNDLVPINEIKQEIFSTQEMVKSLEIEIENQASEIETLKADKFELSELIKNISNGNSNDYFPDTINRLEKLEKRVDTINTMLTKADDFIWKIDNFCQKQKKFLSMLRIEIISEPFYSHKSGYKMRLKVNPNGYGNGLNNHLFISFCLMKGDFDDILEWPFKHVVNISVIDQNTGKDHTTFSFQYDKVPDTLKDVFLKPTTPVNNSLGEDEFIRLDELNNHPGLLKNDLLIIRCYVTQLW